MSAADPQPPHAVKSCDLRPGTRVRHVGGRVMILDRRKRPDENDKYVVPYHPGWWLRDEPGGPEVGGLADFVLDAEDSDWTVVR